MSHSFDPDASASLLELVTRLQLALDASAVTATKRSQIAIVVLTGFMAIASRE
jgi:folate-dependent phosphoribosylglycinamide formyltransferase PurN